ncbi:MAG TPA: hypothetical protein VFY26_16075 [Anaerolineales bacterium]|nr:hypothetical protein [Anaerolineales bacterium]
MDSGNAVIGALIFLALIIGANIVMYAIARGAARGGSSNWMNALKQGLSKPLDSQANKSMDELHQKMEELQKDSRQKNSKKEE